MNFQTANEKLGARGSLIVANNTRLIRLDVNRIALRLHQTDILTWHANGRTVVNTGGFLTMTTKDRLNCFLPHGWRIYQGGGLWTWSHSSGESAPFTDGDAIGAKGGLYPLAKAKDVAAQKKTRREVLAYAMKCAAAVPLARPGPGDCWHCVMRTSDGQTLGDKTKDTSHLLSHIAEGYCVPSLVADALKEAGNTPEVIAGAFQGQENYLTSFARSRVKPAVASYIFRRLGMVARGGWGTASALKTGKPSTGFAVR